MIRLLLAMSSFPAFLWLAFYGSRDSTLDTSLVVGTIGAMPFCFAHVVNAWYAGEELE